MRYDRIAHDTGGLALETSCHLRCNTGSTCLPQLGGAALRGLAAPVLLEAGFAK
jgi:hypothetical protein